jgi:hypothetical protein
MGRIQVRGIGHPVATYRAIGLRAAAGSAPIRSELPHLKLDADPARMSAHERSQAAALLREALDRIAPTEAGGRSEAAPTAPRTKHLRSA